MRPKITESSLSDNYNINSAKKAPNPFNNRPFLKGCKDTKKNNMSKSDFVNLLSEKIILINKKCKNLLLFLQNQISTLEISRTEIQIPLFHHHYRLFFVQW